MVIDIVNREVRAGHSITHLSGIEQSLLYLLASRNGRVVSREEILDAVWGTDFVAESNIVDRHIRSLRVSYGTTTVTRVSSPRSAERATDLSHLFEPGVGRRDARGAAAAALRRPDAESRST